MDSLTRRTIVSVGGGLVLGGCLSAQSDGDSATNLCGLGFHNRYPGSVMMELRVTEGDTVLIERSEELGPQQEVVDDANTPRHDVFTVPTEELPSDSGQYSINMQVNEGGWQELSTADVDADQVSVTGRFQSQEAGDEDSPYLVIDYTTHPNVCE